MAYTNPSTVSWTTGSILTATQLNTYVRDNFLALAGTGGFPVAPWLTNSLAANVALNNTASFFAGPTVAQGLAGIWFASGTVVVTDTAAAVFYVRLWDGTTGIASAYLNMTVANNSTPISVSGVIASPTGNIRIDVRDLTNASGSILFNGTAISKDSTLTVVRIG